MSKGLGKIQRKIIEVLEYNTTKGREWHDVGSLAYQVIYDIEIWNRVYDSRYTEPTESQKQSIWRAVRQLEERGLIASKAKEGVNFLDRLNSRRGGVSHMKLVKCLVHTKTDMS